MARPETIKSKRAKLWKVISEYIRRRDAINDYALCFTCGTNKHWKEFDAGHFVPKTTRAIEYDERNIHSQCTRCNRYMSGNIHAYFVNMENRYGRAVVDELLSHKGTTKKWTMPELDSLLEEYTIKLKGLDDEF